MTITVGDIEQMINFIDVVASRGAIQGGELMAVANLRTKLVDTLEAAKQSQQAREEQAQQDVATSEDTNSVEYRTDPPPPKPKKGPKTTTSASL